MMTSGLPVVVLLVAAVVTTGMAAIAGEREEGWNKQKEFYPTRISFEDLSSAAASTSASAKDIGNVLVRALRKDGMVSITGVPDLRKKELLSSLPSCLESEYYKESTITLPDGNTRRRTLATHSAAGGLVGQIPLRDDSKNSPSASSSCKEFDAVAGDWFRPRVAQVTRAFSEVLSRTLFPDGPKTILHTSSEEEDAAGGGAYTLQETVQQGEQLEHFHVYEKINDNNGSSSSDGNNKAIDWHLDQGLALIFTPGTMILDDGHNGKDQEQPPPPPCDDSKEWTGFWMQRSDGSAAAVQFDTALDDLVIMLGDGVDQYLNTHLPQDERLRAVPHALELPLSLTGSGGGDRPRRRRVWYGRMVLPPPEALHPMHPGRTFKDLRQQAIAAMQQVANGKQNEPEVVTSSSSLGCSSNGMRILQQSDEVVECTADQFLCWHRCFNHTETESPEACEAEDLSLACVDTERKLWTGQHNPAFGPGCVDLATAENSTIPLTGPPGGGGGNHTAGGKNGTTDDGGHDDHSGHDHGPGEHGESDNGGGQDDHEDGGDEASGAAQCNGNAIMMFAVLLVSWVAAVAIVE